MTNPMVIYYIVWDSSCDQYRVLDKDGVDVLSRWTRVCAHTNSRVEAEYLKSTLEREREAIKQMVIKEVQRM